jgi:hypothetical protein
MEFLWTGFDRSTDQNPLTKLALISVASVLKIVFAIAVIYDINEFPYQRR